MGMVLAGPLLKVLACPQCKGAVEYQEITSILICHACELGYPVKDGIPMMLVDLAHKLENSGQSDLTR